MNQQTASVRSNVYLKHLWANFHNDNPQIRIRDAARQLSTSEAQLVAMGCGERAVRLTGDWSDRVKHLPLLGGACWD